MSSDSIFVSWIRHHGRSEGIATALGIESHFIPGGSGPAPLRYARAWRATARLVRRARPASVIVMQPPVVALLCVALAAPRSTRLVGDLHTGVFTDPKWRWALPLTMSLLRKRGLAIVTGAELASRVRRAGVRAVEMHDVIASVAVEDSQCDSHIVRDLITRDYALVPLAYAFDEPLDALLDAARETPQITWVLTGRPPQAVRSAAPSNVLFPGFVSNADYGRLVAHATVMVALTTQEDTMQRVGYEALASDRPLVTSGTRVLREFFGDAALYTEPTSESISAMVRQAHADRDELRVRIQRRRRAAEEAQAEQLHVLRGELQGSDGS